MARQTVPHKNDILD